jgi:hypothetical protein
MKERKKILKNLKIDWCEKIKIALEFHSQDLIKKTLNKTFLDIIVRWYPQIDQEGYDSYSPYYNCRNKKATLKGRLKLLTRLNLKFSKDALEQIKKIDKPAIHFEHNPPVDYVVKSLIQNKDSFENKESIFEHLNRMDYSVVILTKAEAKKLEKDFKTTGQSKVRLECALGETHEELLKLKAYDIKNIILLDRIKHNTYTNIEKNDILNKIVYLIMENLEIFPESLCKTFSEKNRNEQINKLMKEVNKEYEKERMNTSNNNDL